MILCYNGYIRSTKKVRRAAVSLNTLLSAKASNWIIDVVVILFALIMFISCAKRGFIDCFFGAISTTLALVVAFSFAKIFVSMTDGVFGLADVIQGKLETSFAKIEGFTADVSKSGVEQALAEQNVSAILAGLVMKLVGKQDTIAAGTTLAMLLGEATAGLAINLIAGFILFVLTKIVVWFLGGVLNVFAESIHLVKGVNVLLGAVVGVLEALLIVCSILAVLAIFPNEKIAEFLSETLFVGSLYVNNPLIAILGKML